MVDPLIAYPATAALVWFILELSQTKPDSWKARLAIALVVGFMLGVLATPR